MAGWIRRGCPSGSCAFPGAAARPPCHIATRRAATLAPSAAASPESSRGPDKGPRRRGKREAVPRSGVSQGNKIAATSLGLDTVHATELRQRGSGHRQEGTHAGLGSCTEGRGHALDETPVLLPSPNLPPSPSPINCWPSSRSAHLWCFAQTTSRPQLPTLLLPCALQEPTRQLVFFEDLAEQMQDGTQVINLPAAEAVQLMNFTNKNVDELVAKIGKSKALWRRVLVLHEWLLLVGHSPDTRLCTTVISPAR